jgi:spermidine synthase
MSGAPRQSLDSGRRGSGPSAAILLLFLASGAAALVYQVAFVRLFVTVFGATAYAVSTVLAVFMGGLALGSWLLGREADRTSRPLLWYAVLEGLTGLWCLGALSLLGGLRDAYVSYFAGGEASFATLTVARMAMAAIVLGPPTILMGGTLPFLSVHVVRSREDVGRGITRLYAVNTLGAAIGTLVTTFFLIAVLGVTGSVGLAAALNLLVGLAALVMDRRARSAAPEPERAEDERGEPEAPVRWRGLLVIGAFAGGALMLSLEVTWTHLLAQVVGTSVYAFGTMLFTFLIGLAWGSRRAERYAAADDATADRGLARAALLGGAAVVAMLPFWCWAPLLFRVGDPSFLVGESLRFAVCFGLMIWPTIALGMVFPLIIRCATGRVKGLGSGVGRIYAANTVGAILGSIGTGFVLLPVLGSRGSVAVAGGISLALGGAFAARISWRRGQTLAGLGIVAAILAAVLPIWNTRILNSGANVYFSSGYVADGEPFYYVEDVQGGVTSVVNIDGVRTLLTNGKFQGNVSGERAAQAGFALFPMLYAPRYEQALVIGLGTGMTTGVVSTFPFKRIHVVELSGAIAVAARDWFGEINRGVLSDPRTRLHINDGRNHLLLDRETYDVVTVELTSIWFAGAGNLYNREFYDLVRARLSKGGVFSQWIQLHHMRWEDLSVAIATLRDVFPHVVLYLGDEQGLMIASGSALDSDPARLAELSRRDGVRENLALYGASDLRELFGRMLCDEDGVTALYEETLAGSGPGVSTDDHPLLEYGTPRGNYELDTRWVNARRLAGYDRDVHFRPEPGTDEAAVIETTRLARRLRSGLEDQLEEAR